MRPRPRLALLAGAAYGIALAAIGFWPSHVDEGVDLRDIGAFRWFVSQFNLTYEQAYDVVEFGANVLLFVPLALLACTLWPRLTRARVILMGLALSAVIETGQAVLLPGRTASTSDIVANTLGTALGASFVVWWRYRPSAAAEPTSTRLSRRTRQVLGLSLLATLLLQADRSPFCPPVDLPAPVSTFGQVMQPSSPEPVPASEVSATVSADQPSWLPASRSVRWDASNAFTYSNDPQPFGTFDQHVTRNAPMPNPAIGAEFNTGNSTLKNADVRFKITGRTFAIRFLTKKQADAMVWIDGRPLASKPFVGTDPDGTGVFNWITVTLPQTRTMEVRFAGPGVFTGVDYPIDQPASVSAGTSPYTIGVVSDSYYEPSLAPRSNSTSAAPELSTLTGLRVWNMSQAGTGYLNDGSGFPGTGRAGFAGLYSTPFGSATRLAALKDAPVDSLLLNGSFNDGPPWTVADHRAAVDRLLTAVAKERPELPVVIVGIEPVSILRSPDEALGRFTDMSNTFRCMVARHDNVVGFIDPYAANWLTGTGSTKDPRGDGNQDAYISADGVHPNGRGQVYYQSRVVQQLKDMSRVPRVGAS